MRTVFVPILCLASVAYAKPSKATKPVVKPRPNSIVGTVDRYLLAPKGEVDGFLLKDGTTVRIAPELSYSLINLVRPGDGVSVVADFEVPVLSPSGRGVHAISVTNRKSGASIDETPPAHVPVESAVSRFLFNRQGETDGAILEDGIQVRFPPPVGEALQVKIQRLKKGEKATLSTVGPLVRNRFGRVVDAGPMTLNGDPVDAFGSRPAAARLAAPKSKKRIRIAE